MNNHIATSKTTTKSKTSPRRHKARPTCMNYRRLDLHVEVRDTGTPTICLNSPRAVAAFAAPLLSSPQKVFLWIAVDVRKQVVAVQELFRGTADACIVHPRDVFRSALVLAPTVDGLFLVHNHPSGVCEPSQADRNFFDRVMAAGQLLHIPVLDCLVIARDGYFSQQCGMTSK